VNFRDIFDGSAVNAASIGLALLSIILAYIFYRRSLRVKGPSWDSRGTIALRAADSLSSDVSVLFKGVSVPVIAVDLVIFWNSGKETIRNHDLVQTNQLRVMVKDDGEILDAAILVSNNKHNGIEMTISSDRKSAIIRFSYLDEGNGFVAQVISTSRRAITASGSIIGAELTRRPIKAGRSLYSYMPTTLARKFPSLRRISVGFVAGLIMSIVWAPMVIDGIASGSIHDASAVYAINAGIGVLLIATGWRRPPPRGLEEYLDRPLSPTG
jgi:hypothetical protein